MTTSNQPLILIRALEQDITVQQIPSWELATRELLATVQEDIRDSELTATLKIAIETEDTDSLEDFLKIQYNSDSECQLNHHYLKLYLSDYLGLNLLYRIEPLKYYHA